MGKHPIDYKLGQPLGHPRNYRLWLVIVVLIIIAVAAAAWLLLAKPFASTVDTVYDGSGQTDKPKFTLPAGKPQRLLVKSAGIDVPMGEVGLTAGGVLDPEPGIAAWYTEGPKPGFVGPAVIAGHVDSAENGPDVFWNLHKVTAGDKIVVLYSKRKLTFEVTKTTTAPQDNLPKDRIWNKTDQQVLRLITCSGDFNRQTKSYSDNLIVYAHEVSSQPLAK